MKAYIVSRLLLFSLLFFTPICVVSQKLVVDDLQCENKSNFLGIDEWHPNLSWRLLNDTLVKDVMQTASRIQVVRDVPDFKNASMVIWDTEKQESDQSVNVVYQGKPLEPQTKYFWRVKIWDNHGRESNWSKPETWETGFMGTDRWKAKWIIPDTEMEENTPAPSPMLRKDFIMSDDVKKARLYISSRGLYHATLNGELVTENIFTPGWTSYNKRIQYQVYDVTKSLKSGENAAGVTLGDGWYRGRFFSRNWHVYGDKLALIFQLEVEYANGKSEIIVSDETWKATTGPIVSSSIYDGVVYNANLEIKDWDKAGFDDGDWNRVKAGDYPLDNLVATVGPPVKRIQEIEVNEKIITPKGERVFDFGQNLTGRVRFKLNGKKGDTITILHAEVLDQQGNFYTDNLRTAKQRVRYIFKDDKPVIFEPQFTFQGFRYIKIEDFPGEVEKDDFTALVIHSDMEPTGNFVCSDSLVNQLHENIRWGMKGNFLDVPTDCPQRDERCGWTGDVQVFSKTSNYLFNTLNFYRKWLADVRADQRSNGSVLHVVPFVFAEDGSAGWGDVITVLPWHLYQSYGDRRILENNYESMKRWVDYLHRKAGENYLVQKGKQYGDWLFFIHPTDWDVKPGHTDKDLIATAFFAHSTKILANSAHIIGREKDAEYYESLFNRIRQAFNNEFVTPAGRLSSNSQTAYALALTFNLLPEEKIQNAVNYLVDNIRNRGDHLSTGFLGTPHLCPVLSEYGNNDLAYRLLLQKSYPSWLYPVTKGATTVWERWDGIKPDGGFQTTRMNSFNHYAYGAIAGWLYESVAGIRPDPGNPGYKHVIIKPKPDESLSYARASYKTPYGKVESSWKFNGNDFELEVVIPSNTRAAIYLPFKDEIREVGSGKYKFGYLVD